jgi:hypothetical protein
MKLVTDGSSGNSAFVATFAIVGFADNPTGKKTGGHTDRPGGICGSCGSFQSC